MPENMHKKNFSMANRQDGVPTQGEQFNEDPVLKWHDFYNLHTPPPGYQSAVLKAPQKLKVDVNAPDQLYYYLPRISTEAKVFFTDRPGGTKAVAKAIFMDRMSTKPAYHYPPAKQAQQSTSSITSGFPRIQPALNVAATNASAAARDSDKPYVYKPKDLARPNVLCAVDYQALANQRSFLAEGHRQSYNASQSQAQPQQIQPHQLHQPYPQAMQYSYPHNDVSRTPTPLRSFPSDQYYSSKTLPAAYQGEYSSFRRQSQGAQTMQRPVFENAGFTPDSQSGSQQRSAYMPPNPYAPGATSRPSSAAQNYRSPDTGFSNQTRSGTLDDAQTDVAYIQNLQKFPYLMNSYCRRAKIYESPYPLGGGFATKYQPLEMQNEEERKPVSHRTPSGSISGDSARPGSQHWTPPSKTWTGPPPVVDSAYRQQTQNQPQQAAQRYVQVSHQTPQEFQRQISGMPSTASREGAHARMLREQGYMSYSPSNGPPRNSFGQTYDTAKMWHSPQAPTPSPLSDGYAPARGRTPSNGTQWTTMMPRQETAQMVNQRPPQQYSQQYQQHSQHPQFQQQPPQQLQQQHQQSQQASGAGGYGPMLPQMGGHETWRYN
jgi:hypothetical protein